MKTTLSAIAGLLLTVPLAAGEVVLGEWVVEDAEAPSGAARASSSPPSLSIPLDEAESKEAVLKKVSDHFGIEVSDVPEGTGAARLLDALGTDDLADVVESLTGVDANLVQAALEQHLHGLPPAAGGGFIRKPERYSLEETLARMPPAQAAVMEGYAHLLTDDLALPLSAYDDMSASGREAYVEFLFTNMKPDFRDTTHPDVRAQIDLALARGWYERRRPTLGKEFMRKIAAAGGKPTSASEYRSWGKAVADAMGETYLVSGHHVVVPNSGFGGLLYTTVSSADGVIYNDPNLRILGRDGEVATHRHPEGDWTTTVRGFDGSTSYEVALETPRRLVGPRRDEFVTAASALIEDMSARRAAYLEMATAAAEQLESYPEFTHPR